MAGNYIHHTAVIDASARLGDAVTVGPYAYIGAQVELGERCVVEHHASLQGPLKAGPENHFYQFCSVGERSQDLKYEGEPTYLEIGERNRFREFVTVSRGTKPGSKTVIGDDNLFLAYAHVAHDCTVGNHTIFSNNGTLAGHVTVGDYAIISGLSAIHQFCRIGAHAMIGGCTKVVQDVPPFMTADGNPAEVRGLNAVGLKRRGFSTEETKALRAAYRRLYDRDLNASQALEQIEAEVEMLDCVRELVRFVRESERGIIR
ncbi:MAG: acyl-ACP--UDP-N-acetylglucosamine O-acyltransferase [Verrucomicrobiota bacterium]